MAERERKFSISQDEATSVFRQLRTGSGAGRRRVQEQDDTWNLIVHLGINSTVTSSPEYTVLGKLLIAYVNTTTRSIGIIEGEDPRTVNNKIHEHLTIPDGENSQQTLERLLNIAIKNSELINPPHSS